jgi:hypothetical protein
VHAPAARVNRRPSARELKQPGPELAGQETIKHSTLRALRRAQNKRHPRAAGAAVCPREAPVKSFFRLFCTLAPLVSAAFGQGNVVKTPAVRAQMSKLYANARQSFVPTTNGLTRKTELSFTLSADGAPNQVASSHDWTHDSVRVHRGDTAIVHTHPFATSPRPSDGDVAIAVKLGIPNYVLSYYALWVAMPDGGVEQVADVQWRRGQLVLKQRGPIPQNLAKQSAHPTSGMSRHQVGFCRRMYPYNSEFVTEPCRPVYLWSQCWPATFQ